MVGEGRNPMWLASISWGFHHPHTEDRKIVSAHRQCSFSLQQNHGHSKQPRHAVCGTELNHRRDAREDFNIPCASCNTSLWIPKDACALRMPSYCLLQVDGTNRGQDRCLAPIEGWILLGKLSLMRNICKAHHMAQG